jgi:hypothetical protein
MRLSSLFLWGCLVFAQAPVAFATTVTPPQFSELVAGADYIVRARVTALEAQVTERPGQPPLIYTRVTLEVIETIAGQPPASPVLTVLGGRAGGHELRVEGVPEFSVGQEEVFFVYGNGRVFYPLYAAMHGRFPIKRDSAGREYVVRANGVQLDDVAEVALPMVEGSAAQLQQRRKRTSTALSPQDFIQRIRTERSSGGRKLEK